MCTKNVNMTDAKNIAMQCQQIFQSHAKIKMRIIIDGLDLQCAWSENGCIPGSQLSASAEQVVPRKSYWCNWAMGTMTDIGRRNPHQERCQLSTIRYVNCQHEGCMAYVHQFCQHDWLEKHCYAVPTYLPIFCRNYTDIYSRWVMFIELF